MKQVLSFLKIRKDRSKLHLHKHWGYDWTLRHVRCGICGNEWWEVVRPSWGRRTSECC